MEYKDLQIKNPGELQKLLSEQRIKLREQRFKAANGQLKDVREIRETRRQIAQIMTKIQEQAKTKPTA